MSRSISLSTIAALAAAVTALVIAILLLPSIVHAAPGQPLLPRITAVEPVTEGGLAWFKVAFDNGAVARVQQPLSAVLGSVKPPIVGATTAYSDGRLFIGSVRMWGELHFTDANGPHIGY